MKTKLISILLLSILAIAIVSAAIIFVDTVPVSITVSERPLFEIYHTYNYGDGSYNPSYPNENFDVVNYAGSVPIEVDVVFVETDNPLHCQYTMNTPFTQTLNPGDNTIHTQLTWITHYAQPFTGKIVITKK